MKEGESNVSIRKTAYAWTPSPLSPEKRLEYFFVSDRVLYNYPTMTFLQADGLFGLGSFLLASESFLDMYCFSKAAQCYMAKKMNDKAREIIEKGLKFIEKREEYDIYNNNEKALLICLSGELDDDVKMFEAAWDLSGETLMAAQKNIITYYLAKSETPERYENKEEKLRKYKTKALKHLYILAEHDKMSARTYSTIGTIELELGNIDKSIEAFEKVIKLDVSEDSTYLASLRIGQCKLAQHKPSEALPYFVKSAEIAKSKYTNNPNNEPKILYEYLKARSQAFQVAVMAENLESVTECGKLLKELFNVVQKTVPNSKDVAKMWIETVGHLLQEESSKLKNSSITKQVSDVIEIVKAISGK